MHACVKNPKYSSWNAGTNTAEWCGHLKKKKKPEHLLTLSIHETPRMGEGRRWGENREKEKRPESWEEEKCVYPS